VLIILLFNPPGLNNINSSLVLCSHSHSEPMSTFVQSFDKEMSARPAVVGENGTLEFSSQQVGDCLVAVFFALVRNLPDERLRSLLEECLQTAKSQPRVEKEIIADLFVLAFQTRDCRGGKGERALFHKLFIYLYREYPLTAIAALPLISEYGSYKDYFKLLELVDSEWMADDPQAELLGKAIIHHIADRLLADSQAVTTADTNVVPDLSLCAKYAPREGHTFQVHHKKVFEELLRAVFPYEVDSRRRLQYRKLLSQLNKSLEVVEVKMCENTFSLIDFHKIPALCMDKYRKAFLNQKLCEEPSREESITGNRFPNSEDRVLARQHLRDVISNYPSSIKGDQLYPHQITSKFMSKRRDKSLLEIDLLEAQWVAMRTKLLEKLEVKRSTQQLVEGAAFDLGKLIPLVDVSGSMSGTPMEVAIALGILISEINQPSFRNRLITFESNPSWVLFKEGISLQEKVHITQEASWGMSTDIEKAFSLIEKVVVDNKLSSAEVPDLIIFSDMQFDTAVGKEHQTQLDRIRQRFHDIGIKISGTPYKAPRIVFWNLRGDTTGFPAQANDENVQMLSGFSPSLFNSLVTGETAVTAEGATGADGAGRATNKVTPYDTMRKLLDDERYDSVREVLSNSTEQALEQYQFVRPPPSAELQQSKKKLRTNAKPANTNTR
jgi:hypothetical protein